MSNQAKKINDGIEGLGDKIALPRSGFRAPVNRPERTQLRRVGEEAVPSPHSEVTTPSGGAEAPHIQKAPSPYDRITFEITPEQRASLTNIANTLNFRVPREKRGQKINRDMVMRAVLTIAEKIDWDSADEIITEEDLKLFVDAGLSAEKKSTDKTAGN